MVIQTFSPENKVIGLAVSGDYEEFAAQELALREPLRYPPFGRLLRIVVQGVREETVVRAAGACAAALEGAPCRVLGPAPCPIAKVRRHVRRQLIVKARGPAEIGEALRRIKRVRSARGALIAWDVDPLAFL